MSFAISQTTKHDYLEIKFDEKSQVDEKIAWGLGGGYLSFHASVVC